MGHWEWPYLSPSLFFPKTFVADSHGTSAARGEKRGRRGMDSEVVGMLHQLLPPLLILFHSSIFFLVFDFISDCCCSCSRGGLSFDSLAFCTLRSLYTHPHDVHVYTCLNVYISHQFFIYHESDVVLRTLSYLFFFFCFFFFAVAVNMYGWVYACRGCFPTSTVALYGCYFCWWNGV